MQIVKTTDPRSKPAIIAVIYGAGGVGKTTFAATAPKPLLVDCEDGAKYFGLRGINVDVARVANWSDLEGLFEIAASGTYETIIIDPIGELMEKLMRYMVKKNDRKLVQADGSPSMAGWGWLKNTMRSTLKVLRDSGANILILAHVEEKADEDRIIKRPMMMTKLSEELVNMVDIVGYMTVVQQEGEDKRIIIVDPTSDKYVAKDRTGQLGKYIPPDFGAIVKACQGTEVFAWSSETAKDAKMAEVAKEAEAKTGATGKDIAKKMKKAAKKVAKPKVEEAEVPAVAEVKPE